MCCRAIRVSFKSVAENERIEAGEQPVEIARLGLRNGARWTKLKSCQSPLLASTNLLLVSVAMSPRAQLARLTKTATTAGEPHFCSLVALYRAQPAYFSLSPRLAPDSLPIPAPLQLAPHPAPHQLLPSSPAPTPPILYPLLPAPAPAPAQLARPARDSTRLPLPTSPNTFTNSSNRSTWLHRSARMYCSRR